MKKIFKSYKKYIINVARNKYPDIRKRKYPLEYYLNNFVYMLNDLVKWSALKLVHKSLKVLRTCYLIITGKKSLIFNLKVQRLLGNLFITNLKNGQMIPFSKKRIFYFYKMNILRYPR